MIAEDKLAQLHHRLNVANAQFDATYPGMDLDRQPVHTVYGGAQLYSATAASKLGSLALRHLQEYAPRFVDLARALGFEAAGSLPEEHAAVTRL